MGQLSLAGRAFHPIRELGLPILILGVLLSALGMTHRIKKVRKLDQRLFLTIHERFFARSGCFRYLWPIGTTPVAYLLIAMTFLASIQTGIITSIVFMGVSVMEVILKSRTKRARPDSTLPGIRVTQPVQPHDPSYPSGDAMRVWYLALTIPIVFHMPITLLLLTCGLAILLSFGRIVLGVHFPLDVLGGMGLGCIGAGIASLCIRFLPIIAL